MSVRKNGKNKAEKKRLTELWKEKKAKKKEDSKS